MSQEEKSPYYSTSIRMATNESPKDLVGTWNFRMEITYGNQNKLKVVRSQEDVADIEEKDIFEVAQEILNKRNEFGKKNHITFSDQVGRLS